MALSRILNFLPGYRLVDGTQLNQIASNINSLTTNGTSRSLVGVSIPIVVTATANMDFTISGIPSGALIRSMWFYTTTAYAAATDNTIQVGSTVGGVDYVAAVTVKAKGNYSLTLVGASADKFANFTAGSMFARMVQTGTASATGAGVLGVSYEVPLT